MKIKFRIPDLSELNLITLLFIGHWIYGFFIILGFIFMFILWDFQYIFMFLRASIVFGIILFFLLIDYE